jgi:Pyruvate/2-oxoacid:ferredoxin oxidoreductase gamma subunit
VGNVLTAAMVMLGALAALTNLVSIEALIRAVTQCVPPYRRQHVEASTLALTAGARTVPAGTFEAWPVPSPTVQVAR